MQCWINDPATDGIDDKIKMAIILLKSNIRVNSKHQISNPKQIPMTETQNSKNFDNPER